MTFAFDENLSDKIVRGFREFGEEVEHVTEFSPPGTSDIELFTLLQRRNGIFITRNHKFRKKPQEKEALKNCNVSAFFIEISKEPKFWGWIKFFVRHWEDFKRITQETECPFVYRVTNDGFENITQKLYP